MQRFRIFLIYLIFSFLVVGVAFVSSQISEEAVKNLKYPIAELGNCENQTDCEKYCDKPENTEGCLNFAEANNLMPKSEIDMARKLLAVGLTAGPGGCRGEEECEAYCDIPAHMQECLTFALDNDLIPPEERPDAERALAAIKKGATPPPCRGKAACEEYCSKPENLEICLPFGEAAGFITPEEAEMIRKTGGQGPGGCRGKEACEDYCQESTNMEECINFGLQYGLIPPDEAADAQKALEAIKKGVNPPNCRGREECDVYCSRPENAEECINFAAAAGFMTAEEAEMAKKMAKAGIFGGPGGCKGKEECEAYCENPDNMPECVDFAVKAGMMSPEEAEQAKKMAALGIIGGPGGCKGREECDIFCQVPEHMEECIDFGVKAGFMTPEEGEKAKRAAQAGPRPGNCQNEEECKAYCEDPAHGQECIDYAVRAGFMSSEEAERAKQGMEMMQQGPQSPPGMPPEGMPPGTESEMPISPGFPPGFEGKCASPQECQQYCLQNPADPACQAMMPSEGVMPPPEFITPPPTESPPPTEAPQSFFKFLKQSLAGLISLLGW